MIRTVIAVFFIAVAVYIYNNEDMRKEIVDLSKRAMGEAVTDMKEDVKEIVEKRKN